MRPSVPDKERAYVCKNANEKHGCARLRVNEYGCARKSLLSSCQPLEIPGNVIQSCSLKNHSARNSPGQQTQHFVVSVQKKGNNNNNTKRLPLQITSVLQVWLTHKLIIPVATSIRPLCRLSQCGYMCMVLVNSQTSRGLL